MSLNSEFILFFIWFVCFKLYGSSAVKQNTLKSMAKTILKPEQI